MALLPLKVSTPLKGQPQQGGLLQPGFGAPSVWLPSAGLGDLASVSPLTQSAYGAAGIGTNGRTIVHTGTSGNAGFTLSPKSGATYECWLLVFGSTPGNGNSPSYAVAGNTTNGVYINASYQAVLRMASTTRCMTSGAIKAGDVLFVVGKQADYRLYLRGEKVTAGVNYGNLTVGQLLTAASDSLALAARWTNELPADGEIAALLANPWQLIVPSPGLIYVPTAAGGATIALDGAALSISTAGASLTTAIPLSGASASVSSAGGTLTAQITLAGSALAQSLSSALLSTGIVMTAQAVSQAAAQGALATAIQLAANAASQSSASASLGGGAAFAANAQSQSSATASLTVQIQMSATALSQSAASGTLAGGAAQLAALAQSVAAAGGVLTTSIQLSAQAVSQAIATGTLTIQTGLTALAQAVSSASGSLTTQIRLGGSAASTATATANLTTTATNWAVGPIWMTTRAARGTTMTPALARPTRYSTEVLRVH